MDQAREARLKPILPKLKKRGFEVLTKYHAEAILKHDMADAIRELDEVLYDITIPVEELVRGGGGEGELTRRIRRALNDQYRWKKHNFIITKTVDGKETQSISHEIDHVKSTNYGVFALEIEWNNKDPFFDRDLENFKRLHAEGAISVGAIITRGTSLQESMKKIIFNFARNRSIDSIDKLKPYKYDPTERQLRTIEQRMKSSNSFPKAWSEAFVSDKFGESTTHWRKLLERINRGVGNPCPLLLIGIPDRVVKQ